MPPSRSLLSSPSWRVRTATVADTPFLEHIAPRLASGIPPWRDAQVMAATARSWLLDHVAAMGPTSTVLIAEADDGTPIGVAIIGASHHFTGTIQAELGELAVAAPMEGHGVGSALLAAAEAWAHEHGFPRVALGTGAANVRARAFYAQHGYQEEDVRMSKGLS